MKTYTLYSLFFIKNIVRLFFMTIMVEYLLILFWWNANPFNHIRTLWMPIGFTLMYGALIIIIYIVYLAHERIRVDESNIYYYKQRFGRKHVTFYPIEKHNDKIRILVFKTNEDKTFILSLFLQKRRYQKFVDYLKLSEIESNTID